MSVVNIVVAISALSARQDSTMRAIAPHAHPVLPARESLPVDITPAHEHLCDPNEVGSNEVGLVVLALLCLAVSPAQDAVWVCRRPGRWIVPRQERVRDREMRGEDGCQRIADTVGCIVAASVSCPCRQLAGRRDARYTWRDVRAMTLRRRVRQRHLRDGTDVDSGAISRP